MNQLQLSECAFAIDSRIQPDGCGSHISRFFWEDYYPIHQICRSLDWKCLMENRRQAHLLTKLLVYSLACFPTLPAYIGDSKSLLTAQNTCQQSTYYLPNIHCQFKACSILAQGGWGGSQTILEDLSRLSIKMELSLPTATDFRYQLSDSPSYFLNYMLNQLTQNKLS